MVVKRDFTAPYHAEFLEEVRFTYEASGIPFHMGTKYPGMECF